MRRPVSSPRSMAHPLCAVAIVVAWLCVSAAAAFAQENRSLRGVALVVGQSAYERIPALANPVSDAREMVKLLTDLGFDARSVTDRDAERLRRDLERFAEDAEDADVAFLYYAGHGIEAGGENWLVPIDADEGSLDDARDALVALSEVLDRLKASVPVTIVLLDACRTNPFPPGTLVRASPDAAGEPIGASGLTLVRGAARIAANGKAADNLGTVIGFAAEPGLPALDGVAGDNSPYARALLRHLAAMPGVEFGSVMRMVTEEVYLATATRQRPWVNESLRRQLYFGIAPEEPGGEDGLITGERRQLLLTIADLPDLNRVQVEQVAARDGVPLDALYGVLRALGQSDVPREPDELERMLEAQAERLRKMLSEREALRTDDPEIIRLAAAADRAIGEGAIVAARQFMDEAVARVEATRDEVDDLEELVKQKRIADAAVYARRAEALALGFEFRASATDYRQAYDLVARWDETLAWNYKNLEAESLQAHGGATGDRAALEEALEAYGVVLGMLPVDDRGADWAITRNNMAVVLHTMGERRDTGDELQRALAMFEESMAVFAQIGDDVNWAAAQNNIGNIQLTLGTRQGDAGALEIAVAAFRAALEKRDRADVPHDWASTQNNLGIALFSLAERRGDHTLLAEAEVAYRSALEVYSPERTPVDWAMVQNNLGNTLNALGLRRNDRLLHEEAAAAFEAALTVRTRQSWPLYWAASQLNLGNAFNNMARHELGTESLVQARGAYEAALQVFTRRDTPLDWASVQNNLGSVLQTLGQRGFDVALLRQSSEAFLAARRIYRRGDFPFDWAMTHHNLGNTLQLMGGMTSDMSHYKQAVDAYREAMREYTRESAPTQWALSMAGMGASLQALSNEEEGTRSLKASIEARRAALEVLTLDSAPLEWATAQNGLGTCLLNLSNRESNPRHLAEAMAAFEASKQVFTQEAQPLQWAFAQNNIGDVHWSLAAQGGGAPAYRKALDLFESAQAEFSRLGYFPLAALAGQKIAMVKESLGE